MPNCRVEYIRPIERGPGQIDSALRGSWYFHRSPSNRELQMNQNTIEKLLSTLVGDDRQLLETHISWVLLAGDYAWKIKKPVDFGFLDFSSLDKRRFYCEEELRLNARPVSYTHLTLPTNIIRCRSRWSPYH